MYAQYQGGSHYKPRLCVSVNLSAGVWLPSCMSVLSSLSTAVVHTHPWAIPLAVITMRKSIYGFPCLSYMCMGSAWWFSGLLELCYKIPNELVMRTQEMIRNWWGNSWSEIIETEELNRIYKYRLRHWYCLFLFALGPGGTPRPIELHSHDPVR